LWPGKNLTPYGGLLPVITRLEKLRFQSLMEQTLTSKRIPRAMDLYRFVLGIVLGHYDTCVPSDPDAEPHAIMELAR
jgi:hypothetical protein